MCVDEELDSDDEGRYHHNSCSKNKKNVRRSRCEHRRGGHTIQKESRPDPIHEFSGRYRFLSNFYPAPVEFDGLQYPAVEHAFQAAKTLDRKRRIEISLLATPGEAKRVGRSLALRSDWEIIKVEVMATLLREKFSREPFRAKLLATGESELAEGNHWGDQFWGVCNGMGLNILGVLLMQIRKELTDQRS